MAVVIDELESTVEPAVSQSESGADAGTHKGPQPFSSDKLAAELVRVAARGARLKAD